MAHTRDIPVLEVMDPETCYTFWDVILTTDRGLDAVKDVFIFVEDLCEIHMEEIHRAGEEEEEIDSSCEEPAFENNGRTAGSLQGMPANKAGMSSGPSVLRGK